MLTMSQLFYMKWLSFGKYDTVVRLMFCIYIIGDIFLQFLKIKYRFDIESDIISLRYINWIEEKL